MQILEYLSVDIEAGNDKELVNKSYSEIEKQYSKIAKTLAESCEVDETAASLIKEDDSNLELVIF
ncbi:hypothetical protein [Gracilimonas sp.]|uniref:hypothetical protein n=1 Tax=Gracilimonas sp. TaxID=1974203 RepID=UPI0028716741|nr:hypothetical protein [Gracilimonas sp.]